MANKKFEPIIIGFMLVILFASIMIGVLIQSQDLEYGTRDVKCYDRNNNEIYGLVCEEEYILNGDKGRMIGIIGLGSTMRLFISVFITLAFALVSGDEQNE